MHTTSNKIAIIFKKRFDDFGIKIAQETRPVISKLIQQEE